MSDKLQFVARNDKLKLIEHQTDPLQTRALLLTPACDASFSGLRQSGELKSIWQVPHQND